LARTGRDIIVIGTSAGGLEALDALVGQLPTDLPAAIFVVQHMAPENTGEALLHRLRKHGSFKCALAIDGKEFRHGEVCIARPDYHLLVKRNHILVTKGARENRYRPGIDPLFRSAAAAYGPRVIGVVLTGLLDDGTAGLKAVKQCGGITVIQDPKDAAYREMPQSALNNAEVDHCVPIAGMGALLERLVRQNPGKPRAIPKEIQTEALIAERVLSDVARVNTLGDQVPYNCPNCGGILWSLASSRGKRYRCHTGHSFTSAALLTSQTEKIEETLWVSLRMFEERKNLLNNMAQSETAASAKRSYTDKAKETQVHIERIRAMLQAPQPQVTDQSKT
jgi:two-component system chemotaxis response regulator CheB